MSASKTTSDLSTGSPLRALVRLVVPMLVSMVMFALVGLVDAHFIGMLGTDALAAFGLCYPAAMLTQGILFGFSNGVIVSMSQARGRRAGLPLGGVERRRAGISIRLGLALGTLLALLGALLAPPAFRAAASDHVATLACAYWLPYLLAMVMRSMMIANTSCMRGFGETRSTAIAIAIASVFTAGLDPLFIFGWGPIPAFGIAGAAIAAVIAYSLAYAYSAWRTQRALRGAPHTLEEPLAASQVFREVRRVGLPAMLALILVPVGGATVVALATRFGTSTLAGLAITQRVELVVSIVPTATGGGLLPLLGQLFGGGHQRRAAETLRLARRWMACWAIAVGLIVNLAAGPLAALFTDSADVAAVVRLGLLFAPLAYLCEGLNIVTVASFSAVGYPMLATKLYLLLTAVFLPGLALAGSALFGLPGLLCGSASASVATAVLATRWMRLAGLALPVPFAAQQSADDASELASRSRAPGV